MIDSPKGSFMAKGSNPALCRTRSGSGFYRIICRRAGESKPGAHLLGARPSSTGERGDSPSLPNTSEDTPTAVLVRQVLGAIAQFEKATIVAKWRKSVPQLSPRPKKTPQMGCRR
jgi:hypothetical protein